jgi:hypothetical protein
MGTNVRWWSAALAVYSISALSCVGGTPQQPGPGQLRFRVATSVEGSPDTLIVALWMTNVSADTLRVQYGDCQAGTPVWRRLYRPGASVPAWDSEVAYREVVCFLNLRHHLIQVGDSFALTLPSAVSDILGDSLPAGDYDLTVTPRHLYPPLFDQVPAGRVTLRR